MRLSHMQFLHFHWRGAHAPPSSRQPELRRVMEAAKRPQDRVPTAPDNGKGARITPTLPTDEHRRWLKLIGHLGRSLAILDGLEEGGYDCAAYAQHALDQAKRDLRRRLRQSLPRADNVISWPHSYKQR